VACALIITLRSISGVLSEILPSRVPTPLLDIIDSYLPPLNTIYEEAFSDKTKDKKKGKTGGREDEKGDDMDQNSDNDDDDDDDEKPKSRAGKRGRTTRTAVKSKAAASDDDESESGEEESTPKRHKGKAITSQSPTRGLVSSNLEGRSQQRF
jgi:hypothetical protein